MKNRIILVSVSVFVCAASFFARQFQNQNLKVDVDLVQVNATVTDSEGRYVVGLEKKDFHIWEDKVEQQVEYLSTEDAPISVGMILDHSASMGVSLAYAHQAALTFLRTSNADDEYFLVVFSDKPHVDVDLTKDISKLQERIIYLPAKGSTALFDAVYLGMEKIRKASYPKRALIVITDGGENHSRYTFSNLRDLAKEQNVQIFSIGAWGLINNIVEMTGGYAFHGAGLEDICEKIAVELKNEYVIGYRSTNQAKDGRWRKVQLKIDTPRGLSKLNIRGKTGYYAATQ
ncbi:MAG TPA: VWA domain-containing protein [Terriglobia bacterium]